MVPTATSQAPSQKPEPPEVCEPPSLSPRGDVGCPESSSQGCWGSLVRPPTASLSAPRRLLTVLCPGPQLSRHTRPF